MTGWRHARGRAALAASLSLLAASGLAACSPAGSISASPGTFVVARTADIDQLDPQKATAFQTVDTLSLVYDQLVNVDSSGRLVPDLASSWSTSPNGLTVTFRLRTGVRWQDGDTFTSADVGASLRRILNQATGAVARSNLTVISSIATPDPDTVVLGLSRPSTALLYALASVNAAILHTRDITAGTVGRAPDGTGPFAFAKWDQGAQVELTANPHYWGTKPRIRVLDFRVIPSESSILAGMRAGAFQLGQLSDPAVAAQAVAGKGRFTLVKQPSLSYHALMLNGRRGPLRNLKARQAIACAVNRHQVLATAAYGDGEITGPITSPSLDASPTAGLPCRPGDLATARSLLKAAGFPHGFTLNTIVETGAYATAVAEAQNLQAQLAAIGVKLRISQLPTAPYVQAWLAGDYDAAVALNGGSYDPYLMYGRYFVTGGSLSIPAGMTDPVASTLLTEGDTSTRTTTRQSDYTELQRRLLTDSPWIWTFRGDDYYLVGSGVTGFTPRSDGLLTSLASAAGGH